MQIRHAKLSDAEKIAQLEAASFPAAEAATPESIKDRVEKYGNHFWLLIDDEGEISAFVNGLVTNKDTLEDEMYEDAASHDENGDWQMIFSVVTDPEKRHRGYAKKCLEAAIQDAKDQGRKGLVLTCKDHLVGFYGQFGFENEGFTGSTHGGVDWNQMRLTF